MDTQVMGTVPKRLKDKRVLSLELGLLVADTKYPLHSQQNELDGRREKACAKLLDSRLRSNG